MFSDHHDLDKVDVQLNWFWLRFIGCVPISIQSTEWRGPIMYYIMTNIIYLSLSYPTIFHHIYSSHLFYHLHHLPTSPNNNNCQVCWLALTEIYLKTSDSFSQDIDHNKNRLWLTDIDIDTCFNRHNIYSLPSHSGVLTCVEKTWPLLFLLSWKG